ncbi:hypothetical protein HDU96_008198 [Phlyctochytrium bullatum]|nr:hypothetical protein HDU96_008198 [Phlyctochytrium bullatum]
MYHHYQHPSQAGWVRQAMPHHPRAPPGLPVDPTLPAHYPHDFQHARRFPNPQRPLDRTSTYDQNDPPWLQLSTANPPSSTSSRSGHFNFYQSPMPDSGHGQNDPGPSRLPPPCNRLSAAAPAGGQRVYQESACQARVLPAPIGHGRPDRLRGQKDQVGSASQSRRLPAPIGRPTQVPLPAAGAVAATNFPFYKDSYNAPPHPDYTLDGRASLPFTAPRGYTLEPSLAPSSQPGRNDHDPYPRRIAPHALQHNSLPTKQTAPPHADLYRVGHRHPQPPQFNAAAAPPATPRMTPRLTPNRLLAGTPAQWQSSALAQPLIPPPIPNTLFAHTGPSRPTATSAINLVRGSRIAAAGHGGFFAPPGLVRRPYSVSTSTCHPDPIAGCSGDQYARPPAPLPYDPENAQREARYVPGRYIPGYGVIRDEEDAEGAMVFEFIGGARIPLDAEGTGWDVEAENFYRGDRTRGWGGGQVGGESARVRNVVEEPEHVEEEDAEDVEEEDYDDEGSDCASEGSYGYRLVTGGARTITEAEMERKALMEEMLLAKKVANDADLAQETSRVPNGEGGEEDEDGDDDNDVSDSASEASHEHQLVPGGTRRHADSEMERKALIEELFFEKRSAQNENLADETAESPATTDGEADGLYEQENPQEQCIGEENATQPNVPTVTAEKPQEHQLVQEDRHEEQIPAAELSPRPDDLFHPLVEVADPAFIQSERSTQPTTGTRKDSGTTIVESDLTAAPPVSGPEDATKKKKANKLREGFKKIVKRIGKAFRKPNGIVVAAPTAQDKPRILARPQVSVRAHSSPLRQELRDVQRELANANAIIEELDDQVLDLNDGYAALEEQLVRERRVFAAVVVQGAGIRINGEMSSELGSGGHFQRRETLEVVADLGAVQAPEAMRALEAAPTAEVVPQAEALAAGHGGIPSVDSGELPVLEETPSIPPVDLPDVMETNHDAVSEASEVDRSEGGTIPSDDSNNLDNGHQSIPQADSPVAMEILRSAVSEAALGAGPKADSFASADSDNLDNSPPTSRDNLAVILCAENGTVSAVSVVDSSESDEIQSVDSDKLPVLDATGSMSQQGDLPLAVKAEHGSTSEASKVHHFVPECTESTVFAPSSKPSKDNVSSMLDIRKILQLHILDRAQKFGMDAKAAGVFIKLIEKCENNLAAIAPEHQDLGASHMD